MNRSDRLYNLLKNAPDHELCSYDAWSILHTAPMRAAHELRKFLKGTQEDIETVRFHTHGEASYAVYQLKQKPKQLSIL